MDLLSLASNESPELQKFKQQGTEDSPQAKSNAPSSVDKIPNEFAPKADPILGKIDLARRSGYSDDEILAHLSEKDPRVKKALAVGYKPKEIIDHLYNKPSSYEQPKPKKSGLGDKVAGVVEAGLQTATGMASGTVAMTAGVLGEVLGGKKGLPEQIMEDFTYQPRGEEGQEYGEAIGAAMEPLMYSIPALQGEMGALSAIKRAKAEHYKNLPKAEGKPAAAVDAAHAFLKSAKDTEKKPADLSLVPKEGEAKPDAPKKQPSPEGKTIASKMSEAGAKREADIEIAKAKEKVKADKAAERLAKNQLAEKQDNIEKDMQARVKARREADAAKGREIDAAYEQRERNKAIKESDALAKKYDEERELRAKKHDIEMEQERQEQLTDKQSQRESKMKGRSKPQMRLMSGVDPVEVVKELARTAVDIKDFTKALVEKYGPQAAEHAQVLFHDAVTDSQPVSVDGFTDKIHMMKGDNESVQTSLRHNYEAATKDGMTEQMREKFRDYGDGLVKLDAEEQRVYDKYIAPLKERTDYLLKTATKFATSDEERSQLDSNFNPRIALGHMSTWDRILGGDGSDFSAPVGKVASILKSRKMFALEDSQGNRMVVANDGGKVLGWDGQSVKELGKGKAEIGETYNGLKVVQATEKEIEDQTNLKYLRDDLAVRSIKLMELEKYVKEREFLDDLTKSGDFHLIATKDNPPSDWRAVKNPNMVPPLREYYFDPKFAEIIEDQFGGLTGRPEAEVLKKFNNFAVASILLDPIPHINNELWHYFTSRGLVKDYLNPMGLGRMAKSWKGSLDSVVRQDEFQRQMMKEGAPLMYPRVANQGWIEKMLTSGEMKGNLEKLQSDPSVTALAKTIGTPVAQLFKKASEFSSKGMWIARDAMYTSLVKEEMAKSPDISMKDAINHVNEHMPTYRIPPRVLEGVLGAKGGRVASSVMQNPVVSVFSRYHYGALTHFANTVKDISSGDLSRMGKGLDVLASQYVGYTMMYGALDKILQGLLEATGMEPQDAEEYQWRRAGGAHLIELAQKGFNNETDLASIMLAILTPSPGLKMAMDTWNNRDSFTGKENLDLGDMVGSGVDMAAKTAKQTFSPLRGPMDVASGSKNSKDLMMELGDVQHKSADKEAAVAKALKFKERARKSRNKKRPEYLENIVEMLNSIGE